MRPRPSRWCSRCSAWPLVWDSFAPSWLPFPVPATPSPSSRMLALSCSSGMILILVRPRPLSSDLATLRDLDDVLEVTSLTASRTGARERRRRERLDGGVEESRPFPGVQGRVSWEFSRECAREGRVGEGPGWGGTCGCSSVVLRKDESPSEGGFECTMLSMWLSFSR